jgi:ketosteroid isomerase-like protein
MQKFILIPLLILMLSTSAQTKDETAVAAAVEVLRKAMVDGDREALNRIAADKLSYGHSSGLVENKQQFVEKIASGVSDFVSIDLANQTISVSGNAAIVRHELHAKTNDGGKPGEAHIRVLLIFQKLSGKWVMLARQAVKIL